MSRISFGSLRRLPLLHEPHVFCTLSHAYGFVHLHVPSTHERPCLVSHTIFKLHLPFNVVAFVVFLLNGKIKKIILLKKTIKTILFLNRCDHRWDAGIKTITVILKNPLN